MSTPNIFGSISRTRILIFVVLLGFIICSWYLASLLVCGLKYESMQRRRYEFPRIGNTFKPVSDDCVDLNGCNASAQTLSATNTTKMILAWTSMYEDNIWFGLNGEAAYAEVLNGSGCTFTTDKSLVSKADMLLFHGCFQQRSGFRFPLTRHVHQVYVYVNAEAPTSRYCQNQFIPADGVFNITATYKLDSDVVFSYGPTLNKQRKVETSGHVNRSAGKTELAFWYMSDCSSDWSSERHRYVQELRKFMKVDVYGSCRKYFPDSMSACPKSKDRRMDECFRKQSKRYKFYLSFENALCSDYITEKLFKILQTDSDVVPVVFGPPVADYEKVTPPGSFIHVGNFSSPESLAKYLKYLDSNDEAYNAYHKWRSMFYYDPLPGRYSVDQHPPSQLQALCQLAHRPPSPKVWDRLSAWFSIHDNCRLVANVCTDFGICTP